jgi:hypothetical protein
VAIGTAEVRAIFNSGSGKVAGCMVTDGKLVKGCGCKIIRAGEIVHTDNLFSLRRVKELAKEVRCIFYLLCFPILFSLEGKFTKGNPCKLQLAIKRRCAEKVT